MNQTPQATCLIAAGKPEYVLTYDDFPPDVRLRLQNSKYNLCAECVAMFAYSKFCGRFHVSIDYMEGLLQGKDMSRMERQDWYGRDRVYWDDRFDNEYIKQDFYTKKMQLYGADLDRRYRDMQSIVSGVKCYDF